MDPNELTPEQIAMILSTINSDDQLGQSDNMMGQAQALRGKEYNSLNQAGRVVTANPMAALGPVIDALRANKLQKEAEKQRKQVYSDRTNATNTWLMDYLRKQKQTEKPGQSDYYDPSITGQM